MLNASFIWSAHHWMLPMEPDRECLCVCVLRCWTAAEGGCRAAWLQGHFPSLSLKVLSLKLVCVFVCIVCALVCAYVVLGTKSRPHACQTCLLACDPPSIILCILVMWIIVVFGFYPTSLPVFWAGTYQVEGSSFRKLMAHCNQQEAREATSGP